MASEAIEILKRDLLDIADRMRDVQRKSKLAGDGAYVFRVYDGVYDGHNNGKYSVHVADARKWSDHWTITRRDCQDYPYEIIAEVYVENSEGKIGQPLIIRSIHRAEELFNNGGEITIHSAASPEGCGAGTAAEPEATAPPKAGPGEVDTDLLPSVLL